MEYQWVLPLLIKVWKMRLRQNRWFRHHQQIDLIIARQLEIEVDRELARRLIIVGDEPISLDTPEEVRPTGTPEQANLFPTEEGNDKT